MFLDVFRKGKFGFLSLTEAKLKGNGEVPWCGVNTGVQEMERAREGCGHPVERCVVQYGERLWIC